jgi:hypothetical protein
MSFVRLPGPRGGRAVYSMVGSWNGVASGVSPPFRIILFFWDGAKFTETWRCARSSATVVP